MLYLRQLIFQYVVVLYFRYFHRNMMPWTNMTHLYIIHYYKVCNYVFLDWGCRLIVFLFGFCLSVSLLRLPPCPSLLLFLLHLLNVLLIVPRSAMDLGLPVTELRQRPITILHCCSYLTVAC